MQLLKQVILLVTVIILSSLNIKAQTNDSLLNQLSVKWKNAKEYTLKMANSMPAEKYNFRPVMEEMSFKQQLIHIANNMKWLSTSYLFCEENKQNFDTATMDKAAIIQILSNAYDEALLAHQLNDKQLNETISFFAGPKTRRQILFLMHDHQTHHVGQIIVYLRLNGIKPPAYIGW